MYSKSVVNYIYSYKNLQSINLSSSYDRSMSGGIIIILHLERDMCGIWQSALQLQSMAPTGTRPQTGLCCHGNYWTCDNIILRSYDYKVESKELHVALTMHCPGECYRSTGNMTIIDYGHHAYVQSQQHFLWCVISFDNDWASGQNIGKFLPP